VSIAIDREDLEFNPLRYDVPIRLPTYPGYFTSFANDKDHILKSRGMSYGKRRNISSRAAFSQVMAPQDLGELDPAVAPHGTFARLRSGTLSSSYRYRHRNERSTSEGTTKGQSRECLR
jgi:hypothetical protein